jgi:glycosyltransferase involved in cell wall biosynthesis
MSPNFTVIIPTRERADVLGAALRTVTAQNYDALEILVSDNCSGDQTRDVVHAVHDPRIRYVRTRKRISMSHNWEFALSHVSGDRWVMVIGDDDGLMPGALERIAAMIRETGVKAINSSFCTYVWPNMDNDGAGRLLVPMRRGVEIRKSNVWLRRAVEGRAWYSDLPMLYGGGAIHISLIEDIRRRRGTFFQSCQPDIFSSIALASVTDRYAFSHEPFALAGHSRHSNGASWAASVNTSPAGANAPQANELFNGEENIPWHHEIALLDDGKIPLSIDLLVYESYLQAMSVHGNPIKITHQDQLALFLARQTTDTERMALWFKAFIERHRLDPEKVRNRVRLLKARLAWDKLKEYAAAFRDIYRIEPSFGIRMQDVYEASVVAATILRTRPNRVRSYTGTLVKWMRRARTRALPAKA